MDKIKIVEGSRYGVTTSSDVSFKGITFQTTNMFPLIRTTRPNEMNMLMYEKAKHNFKHIDGCVIKFIHAPGVLFPLVDELNDNSKQQLTLDGTTYKNTFSKFRESNLIIPDPSSEYLYKFKEKYDTKLLEVFHDVPRIQDYIKVYRRNKARVEDQKLFKQVRRKLHDDFWLVHNKTGEREMSKMLVQIMNKEFHYFGYGVPFTPVVTDKAYMERAIKNNEACQAIAYTQDRECSTMFVLHKNALKDDTIMKMYYDYVRNNNSTLNIIKFFDLDLHDLDLRARKKYREFLSEIAEIKENNKKKVFMLLEAGHQGYLSMEVFDIVSHSMTGFDNDIDFGKKSLGYWWDERLMIPRPAEESFPIVDRDHCDVCYSIKEPDFYNNSINEKRRIHRLYDLDLVASRLCDSVKSQNTAFHMKQSLGNSEFSSFQEYLINQ